MKITNDIIVFLAERCIGAAMCELGPDRDPKSCRNKAELELRREAVGWVVESDNYRLLVSIADVIRHMH